MANIKDCRVTRTHILIPVERSCQNKGSCEISKLLQLLLKIYDQGQNFQLVGQTPRSRSQSQNVEILEKVVSK